MAQAPVQLKNKEQYDLVTKKLLGVTELPTLESELNLLLEIKTLVEKKVQKDEDGLLFTFGTNPPFKSITGIGYYTKQQFLGVINSHVAKINTKKELDLAEEKKLKEEQKLKEQKEEQDKKNLEQLQIQQNNSLKKDLLVIEEYKKQQIKEAENYLRRLETKTRTRGATFRKAYSTVTTLTPAVTCSISYTLFKTSRDLQIFDVPYNYIKSLKVEMKGSPETTTLTLSLEEPSGNVSSLLVAYLYQESSGINTSLPQINVQWGWGTNERTLSSLEKKGVHSTTLKQTYTINKAEVSYEGLKQKVQLECALNFNTQEIFNKDASPKAVFSDSIVAFLVRNRLVYYHANVSSVKDSFAISTTIPPKDPSTYTYSSGATTWIAKFPDTLSNFIRKRAPFLNNFSLQKNNYFNLKVTKVSEVTKDFASYLDRHVHPYTVFCCVLNGMLNAYMTSLNKYILVLPLFREESIINYESVVYKTKVYPKSTVPDTVSESWDVSANSLIKSAVLYSNNLQNNKDCPLLTQQQTVVQAGDTWVSLVQKYASLVKISYKSETYELSATVVQTDLRAPLIISELNKYLGEENAKKIGITADVLSNFSYVVFIAPKNLNFSQSRAPVQSYTVFPKTKPETKPNRSYFNSGSKNLVDESFPDVIEFKPKLDLIGAINTAILEKKFSPNYAGTRTEKWYFSNETINKLKVEELVVFQKELLKKLKESSFTLSKQGDFWVEKSDTNYLMYFQTLKNETETTLNFNVENNGQVIAKTKKGKIIAAQSLLEDLNSTLLTQSQDEKNTFGAITHTLFVKSQNVSLSDTSSSAYASFVAKSAEYYKKLKQSTFSFEAELKILGEPAYCNYYLMSGQVIKIYLKVNNPDGSENVLLTGVYMVEGVTNEIDEGRFTTTLKLRYDQPNLEYYQT